MVRILLSAMLWAVLFDAATTVETFAETKKPQPEVSRQRKSSDAGAVAASKKDPASSGSKAANKKVAVSSDSKAVVSKKPGMKASGRLPKLYAQLDLDDDQQSRIAGIQESYRSRSADLRKQLAALSDHRDEEISQVLKPKQRERLKELMAESPDRNARGAKSDTDSAQGPDREKKAAVVSATANR